MAEVAELRNEIAQLRNEIIELQTQIRDIQNSISSSTSNPNSPSQRNVNGVTSENSKMLEYTQILEGQDTVVVAKNKTYVKNGNGYQLKIIRNNDGIITHWLTTDDQTIFYSPHAACKHYGIRGCVNHMYYLKNGIFEPVKKY